MALGDVSGEHHICVVCASVQCYPMTCAVQENRTTYGVASFTERGEPTRFNAPSSRRRVELSTGQVIPKIPPHPGFAQSQLRLRQVLSADCVRYRLRDHAGAGDRMRSACQNCGGNVRTAYAGLPGNKTKGNSSSQVNPTQFSSHAYTFTCYLDGNRAIRAKMFTPPVLQISSPHRHMECCGSVFAPSKPSNFCRQFAEHAATDCFFFFLLDESPSRLEGKRRFLWHWFSIAKYGTAAMPRPQLRDFRCRFFPQSQPFRRLADSSMPHGLLACRPLRRRAA